MDRMIVVEARTQYGREALHPASWQAFRACNLLGTKTLTRDQLKQLRHMGFEITLRAPTPAPLKD